MDDLLLALPTSTIIQDRFPGRVVLSPEEVAEVWRGSRSRKAVSAIRKRLSRGTLVPGLKKNGGRWEVPVEGLVKAIEKLMAGGDEDDDEEDAQPVDPQAAPPSGTRRRAIGPRMSDTVGFWDEVFHDLDLLDAQWRRAALSGQTLYGWTQISAQQRKDMADKVLNAAPGATYTDDQAAILCGRSIRQLRRWRTAGKGPQHSTKKVENYTEIVYTREALTDWLKSQPKHQKVLGVMLWNVDEAGRVARKGERDAGSLLDLLQAEHASRESLALAMILYRQQVADELDQAAWRLAAMPEEEQQEPPRVF